MAELTSQKQAPSRFQAPETTNGSSDVVRGGYQPIGKIDIAAIRREAKEKGDLKDDRPTTVKGSYEPIGKVDIAAIRAKAQGGPAPVAPPPAQEEDDERPKSLADRSAAFNQQPERLTSLPKPKVANKFGGSSNFSGTKAPAPSGFGEQSTSSAAPVGVASRTFADEGGKTPAQIWAEKKARQRGTSDAGDTVSSPTQPTPVSAQKSGGWQSGYTGKKWNSVQTTKTGASNISAEPETEEAEEAPSSRGVGTLADRFSEAPPPPLDVSNKPNAAPRGVPMPGLPIRGPSHDERPEEEHVDLPPPPPQPRSPSPPVPSSSPVRIAMPVSRTAQPAEIETDEPEHIPTSSLAQAAEEADPEPEPETAEEDPARGAAQAAAESSFGAHAASAAPGGSIGGKRALIQYDYEKAEDNEIELKEGEFVTNIEMVDEDWWMGQNSAGETGLFPSNYVELVEDDDAAAGPAPTQLHEPEAAPAAGPPGGSGNPTATAQYEYEATEDNEISFPDGAKITDVVSYSFSS